MLNQIETNHGRPPLLTLKNGMAGAREHTRLQTLGVLAAQKRPDLACTVFVKRSRTGNSDSSLLHMAPPEQPRPVEAEKARLRKARSRKGAYLRLPSIRNR